MEDFNEEIDEKLVSWKVDTEIDNPSINSREKKFKYDLEMINKQKEYGEQLARYADDYNTDQNEIDQLKSDYKELEKSTQEKIKQESWRGELKAKIELLLSLEYSNIDKEEVKMDLINYDESDKIFDRKDQIIRIEAGIKHIKEYIIKNYANGENNYKKTINILSKIFDRPYVKAWLRDYMNAINGLEKHKIHLLKIVQEINGDNKLTKELFDAAKNNNLDFFNFPNDETNKIPVNFFNRCEELRKLFQNITQNLEKFNVESWLAQYVLFASLKKAQDKIERKEEALKNKDRYKELSKKAIKNYKANREIISKFRNELDEIIKQQNKKNEWEYEYKGVKIIVRLANLVEEYSDAIVNPANEYLMHDGGAAKAIAEKAGDQLTSDCHEYVSKNGKLQVGNAMISAAGGKLC